MTNNKRVVLYMPFQSSTKIVPKGGFDSVGDFNFNNPESDSWRTKIYKTEKQRNGVSNLCLVSFEQGIPAQQKYSIHVAKQIISYAQIFNIILTSHYQPFYSYTKINLAKGR